MGVGNLQMSCSCSRCFVVCCSTVCVFRERLDFRNSESLDARQGSRFLWAQRNANVREPIGNLSGFFNLKDCLQLLGEVGQEAAPLTNRTIFPRGTDTLESCRKNVAHQVSEAEFARGGDRQDVRGDVPLEAAQELLGVAGHGAVRLRPPRVAVVAHQHPHVARAHHSLLNRLTKQTVVRAAVEFRRVDWSWLL